MNPNQNTANKSITVVIPAYNSALSLPSCLKSVLAQTHPAEEIIVVNDGSSDDTDDLLLGYPVKALKLPRRMGAAYARVAGARAARGAVVAFLDADCIAGPDWLHELIMGMTVDVAGVGGGYRFDESHRLFETFIARLAKDWFSRQQPPGQAILIGGNAAFRKQAFLGRKHFQELTHRQHFASGDDTLLCLELLKEHRLNYLPGVPVRHEPYGVWGFFRRQIRWAKSRTRLFFRQPVDQKSGLVAGPMFNLLFQIAGSGLIVAAGIMALMFPFSLIGIPLFALSVLVFVFFHLELFPVLTEHERVSYLWFPAAFFLWLRSLCYIIGIADAFLTEMRGVVETMADKVLFAYNFIHPRRLFKLYVFVTNRCNRRCEFCFYRDNLTGNEDQDPLSLGDYDKITRNLPLIPYVTLTGGEPFLRNDLDQVALLFYRKNRTRFMVIPTNGSLPEETEELLERLLIDAPELNLTIQVSLNGLEHNLLKGGDSAETALFLDTWNRLGRLKKRFKRLRRHLSLVITRENCTDLKQLAQQIPSQLEPDHFFITPQRSGPNEVSLPHILIDDFIEVLQVQPVTGPSGIVDSAFKLVFTKVRREFINVYKRKKMPASCVAGKKFIVIDPAGQVQVCELINDKIGCIFDDKWNDIKKGSKYIEAVNAISRQNCVCTWGCAIVSNTIHQASCWLKQ